MLFFAKKAKTTDELDSILAEVEGTKTIEIPKSSANNEEGIQKPGL